MDVVMMSEAWCKRIKPPENGMIEYKDEKQRALVLRVRASGVMSWRVVKRFGGKLKPKTLGRWPDIPVVNARELAADALLEIQSPERSQGRATLRDAREAMLVAREYKPRTARDYRRVTEYNCKALLDSPVDTITRQRIADTFAHIESKSQANQAMRVVRAILNYWSAAHDLDMKNPVAVLADTRTWHKNRRKQTVVHAHQLPIWWRSIETHLEGRIGHAGALQAARYYKILLLTGLRSTELSALALRNIDLAGSSGKYDAKGRFLHLPDPKAGTELLIPVSTQAHELFMAQIKASRGPWLWNRSDRKAAEDEHRDDAPNDGTFKHWRGVVIKESGVKFSPHDLRRTFATIAEALDLSPYTIKRLLGHAVEDSNDVTAGYIVSALPRMAKATQQVSDLIMDQITPSAIDSQ